MPSTVAEIRRESCKRHRCYHELDYNDPLAACPEGHFGPWIFNPAQTPVLPALPSQGETPTTGPGTILKATLARLGIKPGPGCKCHARAIVMDKQGPDWCQEHLEEIVGWLKEEAQRAGLPFSPTAARLLIRRAIHKARRH